MSDVYGTVCSNDFKVKDVAKFKEWFEQYYFGDGIELFVDSESNSVKFGGHEQYPSAYPRIKETEGEDAGDINDIEINQFSKELCEHLQEGEILSVVSGGNEKLRYVACDQLIIAQAHPEMPYYQSIRSDEESALLLSIVLSQKQVKL